MRLSIPTLIIVSTGAFIRWTMTGFKGTFDNHMSRYHDTDTKYDKNYWTGIIAIVVLVIVVISLTS
jgi:hypothetical protein